MAPLPSYPNYNSISITQQHELEEAVVPDLSRINKRKALVACLFVGVTLAVLFHRDSSLFFLYGPLLGPYLDGDGASGRRKAVKSLLKLGEEIEGEVLFHNDAKFCDAAEVWQQGLKPPLAVVQVANEADVQLAVPVLADIYLKRGIPFRVRSGGHRYVMAPGSARSESHRYSYVVRTHETFLPTK